jgi:hypothetical protein
MAREQAFDFRADKWAFADRRRLTKLLVADFPTGELRWRPASLVHLHCR